MTAIGVSSLLLWRWTDDLRLYAWVQFFPCLAATNFRFVRAEIQRHNLLAYRRYALRTCKAI